jgi:hypothetical protein
MDARFDTSIRGFGISSGILVENPQNISVAEVPASLGSRQNRGRLCVLIEVLGGLPDPDQTIEQLSGIIRSTYSESAGSITGSIGAALQAANEWLFEANLSSSREERGVAGVSCAVLRDGELYLGQLGPALAYLLQADGMRRFPEDSPWLRKAIPSESERAASPPIGVRRVVKPQFFHASVGVGDTFMLASPDLARLAAGRLIAQALEKGSQEAAEDLRLFAHDRNINVLIISIEAEERAVLPEAPAVELERPGDAGKPVLGRVRTARRRSWPVLPSPGYLLEAAWQPLARGVQAVQTLLRAILPTAAPRRRATAGRLPASRRRGSSGRLVATLVILIPILVLALVFVTRYQYERSRASQVADLLRQASEARSSVMTTTQREAQRLALRQAIELIDEALEIDPEETAALTLRQQVVEELDTASVVYRLYTLWELADLATEDVTAPAELSRVIVHGPDVFFLDVAADRVYHRVLSPAGDALEVPAPDALLVQKGEQRGAIAVGELVDVVWMSAGGERPGDSLLVVERNGSLLEWDPVSGVSVLPVADAANWRKPQAAGAYHGNFYLLDPQQNRILKYLPTIAGYTDPPLDYLAESTQVDLSGAVDMAIDESIYVLLADGSILKFLGGELQSFRVVDIDEPMRNPVAISVTGEGDAQGYVYVADAGLARVVQLTKHGEFIRQFRAAEGQTQLQDLRGLYVDEASQRMYLASGSRLYMAPLSQTSPASPTPVPASPG